MTQQDRDTAHHHMSGAQEFNTPLSKRVRLATYHFRRSVVNRHTPENATEIKRETLEEFLARGGTIQRVATGVALGAAITSTQYVRCSAVAMASKDGNSQTGKNTTP